MRHWLPALFGAATAVLFAPVWLRRRRWQGFWSSHRQPDTAARPRELIVRLTVLAALALLGAWLASIV